MKGFMRKIVAGPKHKTPYQGQDLDLTYITDRIIAMAYPASNFLEKAFRNSIQDVSGYLKQYHPQNYLIINVSSRSYDYELFQNRVLEYQWNDHQSPPLTSLFDMAYKVHNYLTSRPEGVVAVHCNHGKGRTGTAIISMLLYLGFYQTAAEALQFYNSRRFSSKSYGVNQPCQVRYINFVQKILTLKEIPPKLIAYRLSSISQEGLHDKHNISIRHVRTGQMLVDKFNFNFHSKIGGFPLMGDLFIEVFEDSWSGNKNVARINFNSFFFEPKMQYSLETLSKDPIEVVFQGSNIKCSNSLPSDKFSISLFLQYYCLCHFEDSLQLECGCHTYRTTQEYNWKKMIKEVKQAKQFWKQDRSYFPKKNKPEEKKIKQSENMIKQKEKNIIEDELIQLEENNKQQQEEQSHEIYPLSTSMSNIGHDKKAIGVIIEGPSCRLEESPFHKKQIEQQEEKKQQNHRQRRTREFNAKDFEKYKDKSEEK